MSQTPELSESDYFTRQANEAKESAVEAINRAKIALQKQLDPRPLVRNRPLFIVVAASIVGFLAVLFTVPSRKESELRYFERKYRATHPDATATSSNGNVSSNAKTAPAKPTLLSSIIHELVQLIRPIILTAITTSLKGNSTPPPPT